MHSNQNTDTLGGEMKVVTWLRNILFEHILKLNECNLIELLSLSILVDYVMDYNLKKMPVNL